MNYPIGTSPDVLYQLQQANDGVYTNWHPAMHTFVFYKFPISIFWNSLTFVGAFQYFVIALIIAYMGYSFCSFGLKPIVFYISTIVMVANFYFILIIDFPWKDIPYSFGILLLTINCMWIYFTNGEWLRKKEILHCL